MSGTGSPFNSGHGPYHRVRSPTQSERNAVEQERGCSIPAVKAYRGPLKTGDRGIEFFTVAAPSPGSHPTDVFWYEHSADVWSVTHNNDSCAMIVICVTKRV
jgi:hypothetical protein